MKQIISTTGTETRLSMGVTVPADGAADVPDEKLAHMRIHDAHFRSQLAAGALAVVDGDPEAKPEPEITREAIAKAKRADLVEIITGTGAYTEDDLEGVRVEDTDEAEGLRTLAARLVFGDE